MNKLKLKELLAKEKSLTEKTDGLFDVVFKQKVEILREDLEKTVAFLDECTQDEFYWVSNAFEDISEAFRDERFIECLKRNQLRFPEIFDEIQLEIDYAILAMRDKENLEQIGIETTTRKTKK